MSGFFDFIKKVPANANPNVVAAPQTSIPQPPFYDPQAREAAVAAASAPQVASPPDSTVQMAASGIKVPQPTPVAVPVAKKTEPAPPSASSKPKVPDIKTAAGLLNSNISNQKRNDIDVMTHLTQRANRVFMSANTKAKELHNTYVDTEHLLHGLLSDGEIYTLLTEFKVQPQTIDEELNKIYKMEKSSATPQISPRLKHVVDSSLVIARKLGFEFISPEHLLLALYDEGEGVAARVLVKLGIKKEELNKKIIGRKEGLMEDQKETEKKKSMLEQFTIDLTEKASQGLLDPVVERSDVIERLIHILSRRTKNNPALVGEPGVGKTAVVEGLAQKIVAKQVPESLLDKRILELDLMSMLAGTSHRGEFEERMKNLIEEVKSAQGKVILFIDEFHNIVGAGSSGDGTLDASNFLKPALARGELQLVGATTLTEYRKYIEKDPALERRFQQVLVPEPTEEQAIKMVKTLREKYEAFHKVKIPDDIVEVAVKLSKRYVGDRFLPDKAVDLIDEAASAVRLPLLSLPEEIRSIEERISQLNQEAVEAEKAGDKVRARITRSKIDDIQAELNGKKEQFNIKKAQTTTTVTEDIIKDIVSQWTGIPVNKISNSETSKLSSLEEIMHKRLIGQDVAVSAVAQAIKRGRAGLKSAGRPIGSFIFAGPTGVGKTELAKTLADVLFGQEEAMIRFDMTEYMEKHEVAKLLGAPPGYVGYEEGGKLTEAVRRKPYSVVLFDEVEKAHPDIFNILLQMLDDGRLTDNKGRVISFKNTVIICTSNLGSQLIQDELIKHNSNGEFEESALVSSYAVSKDGKEILIIGAKYFERNSTGQDTAWHSRMLLDYFAGQTFDDSGRKEGEPDTKQAFPTNGCDTFSVTPEGVEMISKDDMLILRPAGSKAWRSLSLVEYFKKGTVSNATFGLKEENLPVASLKTHAFTPQKQEIVTYGERFWRRASDTGQWETGLLKDYFAGQTSPNQLPIGRWDVHTFTPLGKEIIIAGEYVYLREPESTVWNRIVLKDYFGSEFFTQETAEKAAVDQESEKKKYDDLRSKLLNELRKFFRPELINRFDEVIVFEPLRFEHMTKIVELNLKSVGKLLEEQEMGFSCTETAMKEVARAGFDPIFGARPLRRAIQKLIENPISALIIDGKLNPSDTVQVDFDGEDFVFNVEHTEMVPVTPRKTEGTKRYTCTVCGNTFTSVFVPNSTSICPHCGSPKLIESGDSSAKPTSAPAMSAPAV
ncbi:AAA domain-containing protein [Candidatus Roizmanbacteria bacterium]|nr:AAA domain-containing protein [Candidatus Roizmanbacteria bacterium]